MRLKAGATYRFYKMPSKTVDLPGVGSIEISKRKGTQNLRLRVTPKGQIKVVIPHWLPYSSGLFFASRRKDWILSRRKLYPVSTIQSGDRIGKSHRIYFIVKASAKTVSSRVSANKIEVTSKYPYTHLEVQAKAVTLAEKALKIESQTLLPQRLKTLAAKHGFSYKSVRVRKLISRWGSCSSSGDITLSYYLMQLPWELIDYVLLHELMHTKHLHHGPDFWESMEKIQPGARKIRKVLNTNLPRVESYA